MPSEQLRLVVPVDVMGELHGLDSPPAIAPDRSKVFAKVAQSIEEKFIRLRDEWKAERGLESSTTRLMMHPAYRKIIGIGPEAVPLLLRELEKGPESWFWALRAITEEDPVRREDCGDGEAMAQAWLRVGRERGYKW